jgi:hypothetical protein
LAHGLAHRRPDDARHQIQDSARGGRHDDAHGPAWKIANLRVCQSADETARSHGKATRESFC